MNESYLHLCPLIYSTHEMVGMCPAICPKHEEAKKLLKYIGIFADIEDAGRQITKTDMVIAANQLEKSLHEGCVRNDDADQLKPFVDNRDGL